MKSTTITLPKELIKKLRKRYPHLKGKKKRSTLIRTALCDFLLMPYSEQELIDDEEAIVQVLTFSQERDCSKISIRIPDDLYTILIRLAKGKTISKTITYMLARILYLPLENAEYEEKRLIYVLGNKWDKHMQTALKGILKTNNARWEWDTSIETCAGGLGIFTCHNFASAKIINDNDWNKANLLKAIRDNLHELIMKARVLEVNEETFNKLKSISDSTEESSLTSGKAVDIDAAVRYLYLNINSFQGNCKSFKCVQNKTYYKRLDGIYPLHQKLQGVKIYDMDIFQIIKRFRKTSNNIFIVDPPYLNTKGYEDRTARTKPDYGMSFGLEQHKELARLLHSCIEGKHKNDFIYFCRITATREKTKEKKTFKDDPKELD